MRAVFAIVGLLALYVIPGGAFLPAPARAGSRSLRLFADVEDVTAPAAGAAAAPEAPNRKSRRAKRTVEVLESRETNGGWSAEVKATVFEKVSSHTVILARSLLEEVQEKAGVSLTPHDVFRAVPLGMLEMGMKLENTEGMLDSGSFPVNYFSVRQLLYFHPNAIDVIAETARKEVGGPSEPKAE